MRNNCACRWSLGALVLVATIIANAALAQEPTAINSIQSSDKLTVTLKAKLPDYKGPSRFVGRKALITFNPDGSETLKPRSSPVLVSKKSLAQFLSAQMGTQYFQSAKMTS